MGWFRRSKKNDFFPHNNQPPAGLMALPAEMPAPNRTMNLHPNIMGDAPSRRFGRNQPGGRAIGWIPPKQKKRIFSTQQPTARRADGIACGNASPKPNNESSSQHHGRRPIASVWPESTWGASNWVGSAEAKKKRFFSTQQPTARQADGIACGNASPKPNDDNQAMFGSNGELIFNVLLVLPFPSPLLFLWPNLNLFFQI